MVRKHSSWKVNGIKIVIQVGVDLHSVGFYLQKLKHSEPVGRAVLMGAWAPA